MKKIIILLMLVAGLGMTTQIKASDLLQRADSAYTADDFQMALSMYQEAMKKDGTSATLWYNIGNCRYRLNQFGQAILAYERSLRLDPAYDDARANLELVNSKITDRAGERGTFIGNLMDSMANANRSNTWAWIAFGTFVLAISGGVMYFFTTRVKYRKIGFFGGIVLVIAAGFFVFLAYRSAANSLADDQAIVIAPSTILSTSPRAPQNHAQEAMLLHEGTKVQVRDSVSTPADSIAPLWYEVQVDNDHRAWINAKDIEKI